MFPLFISKMEEVQLNRLRIKTVIASYHTNVNLSIEIVSKNGLVRLKYTD